MNSHGASPFLAALSRRVLILDGAMGTNAMAFNLPLSDYAGHENCTDILVATRPDVVRDIHARFLALGCDAVETNSFGTNKVVLAEFGLADRTHELNQTAARLARQACDEFSTPAKPRFVLGSIGPGTKSPTLRQITFDLLEDSYAEQARGLIDGGVDALLVETCFDLLQTKAALAGCLLACRERKREDLPLLVQFTMETTGTMLLGSDIAAALATIEAYSEVDLIGLNCATGPDQMSEHVRYLGDHATRYLSVVPNAGLPQMVEGKLHYPLTPEELARWLSAFITEDGVNLVGGCCGTTYAHLEAVIKTCGQLTPRPRPKLQQAQDPQVTSLYQAVDLRQENSFLIVGERCNTNGSRRFKRLLLEGKWEEIVALAKEQIAEGAHVLDVCVDYVGRAGAPDMQEVVGRLATEVTAPVMLDSTQVDVLEAGLKLCPGKCLINSMNLEDGEGKLAKICGLARKYGAAVVALTIDDDPVEAMGKTAARKLAIAKRIYDLAVNKYGLSPGDILWDCLTFPITTGNEADRRLALETLDGIAAVMHEMPQCHSILGLSNVSFGLQAQGRKVLNSVFLHHARERGLTAAIVHVSGIMPMNEILEEACLVAEDLIFDRRGKAGTSNAAKEQGDNYDPLLVLSTMFSEAEKEVAAPVGPEPVEERLKKRIIAGNKAGLEQDLESARIAGHTPLDIINNLLLEGMKVVGDLFATGKMQLPFVLKSAETMKTAVAYLEQFMEKAGGPSRGKIVLATVRGDVHDIGKNLVDIILTNNGYTVYNLGIKQPLQAILDKWQETGADAIGMSGLLVKSTLVMKENLEEMNLRGTLPPVLLGGAALTRGYVENDLAKLYQGPVYYCKDAFAALNRMRTLGEGKPSPPVVAVRPATPKVELRTPYSPAARAAIALVAHEEATDEQLESVSTSAISTGETSALQQHTSDIARDVPIPLPPFWGSRVIESTPLRGVLGFINEVMLFQVQWAHKKAGRSTPDFKKYIDLSVRPIYRRLIETCERENILQPQAIYGYWPCWAEGNDLVIFDPAEAAPSAAPATQEVAASVSSSTQNSELRTQNSTSGRIVLKTRREIARFSFPRQRQAPWWCLSDFFRPAASGEVDVVAFHAVTMGPKASETARQWFAQNRYEDYLYLHGLSVECAEALAEMLHRQVRMEWGIAGHDARKLQELFQQGYQGSRYSFGYPACPSIEDQAILLPLLATERIGLTLSEEYQLHPEQSTTALICHHHQARYFNVR